MTVNLQAGKLPMLRAEASDDAPRGPRALRVASLIALIAELLGKFRDDSQTRLAFLTLIQPFNR